VGRLRKERKNGEGVMPKKKGRKGKKKKEK